MQRPGLAAVERSKALGQTPAAHWFVASAPSYRRNGLKGIGAAKTESTRAKRIAETVRT